ncbi:ABC transporter permease [Fundicoccus ignavus]|uniref:FtsX-like permease family protein n=1 Tax=Fundicoccus ignavus TaxID=2664442 RepID=A0A844C2A1_9LACT|nr:FtsX-like permease family protein [Fundicoccus ignavus]MRJ47252.1 FtsX-like permease family protein [Fundicoccus ignavus]
MKLAFSIGMRFLKTSKVQTAFIVLGIVIGVAVQVFVGSLIEGLQQSLVDGTIGSSPHITIVNSQDSDPFEDDNALYESLTEDERLTAVTKSFSRNGFVSLDEDTTKAVFLRGFDLADAEDIYSFEDSLVEGDIPSANNEVLVGTNFAQDNNLYVGDAIDFLATTDSMEELTIAGIFDLGVASLNEQWVVTDLETSQTLFDETTNLTSIETQIDDVFAADTIASEIDSQVADSNLKTSNWKETNEALLSGLSGQSISSYMIQVFVLVAVLLGIASVLAISAVQKSKQLGILKAMGIKDKTAGQVFLFQGFVLGTFGALIGAGVGLGLMYTFSIFVQNTDGTPLVPFYFNTQFVILSTVIAIIASTIAAFIPAKNSSRLNPMEVIQNG